MVINLHLCSDCVERRNLKKHLSYLINLLIAFQCHISMKFCVNDHNLLQMLSFMTQLAFVCIILLVANCCQNQNKTDWTLRSWMMSLMWEDSG